MGLAVNPLVEEAVGTGTPQSAGSGEDVIAVLGLGGGRREVCIKTPPADPARCKGAGFIIGAGEDVAPTTDPFPATAPVPAAKPALGA